MDGALRRWLVVGLATMSFPAVGCRFFQQSSAPDGPQGMMPAGQQQVGSGWFGSNKPKYGPVPQQQIVREARDKNKPFNPITFVSFADAELEMAYDHSIPTNFDRDAMIDVARQKYQAALKIEPNNKPALLGLGKLYTWAGDRDRALQMYQEAIRLHPKDAEIPYALARSHVRFEDWAGAVNAYDMALAIDPENRNYQKAKGYCQARAEQWEQAFDTLMHVMPESDTRVFLGRTLLDLGKIKEGQQQLEIALQQDPHHEAAQAFLAQLNQPAEGTPVPNTGVQLTGHEGER